MTTTPNEPANRGDEPRRGPAAPAPDEAAARDLLDELGLDNGIIGVSRKSAAKIIATALAAQRAAGAAAERERCSEIVETATTEARRRVAQAIKDDDADIWIELLRAVANFGDDLLAAIRAQPVAPPNLPPMQVLCTHCGYVATAQPVAPPEEPR